MMQVACAATMVGAWFLAVAGPAATGGANLKYDFDTVSANLPAMLQGKPFDTGVAFFLFLVGFGIKMGMWPFGQFWLPDAHPAAPSPISAMLSGVMIKTGVYGLMRYFLWLVPPEAQAHYPLARWGWLVAALGTITLFTGTMQALKQEQSKRLLAFSSIGQVGYILLGTGTCMILLPVADATGTARALAAAGFCGALLHVLNHGMFKGLLFLSAGSLRHATGTQDLNQMGGLMKFMPLTACAALVASLAISGVPLLNGFASKWAIYVATIQGASAARFLPVCGVIAILTSALTLATFMKFFGVSFLGRTSALVNAAAVKHGRLEVGALMLGPQLFLAGLCVLLGMMPALAFQLMTAALGAARQGYGTALAATAPMTGGPLSGLATVNHTALFVPVVLALVLGLMVVFVRALSKLGGAPRRVVAPWLCGYASAAECNRYGAHHFYGEVKRHFRWLGGAPRAHPSELDPTPKNARNAQG
jgi:formate hydrogenlyase subunit 3/multisubunit Na+/H+ antiporter MnhD subunit